MASPPSVAYFSMEIALDEAVPTYSGGLGVLAGDHLRAAADLGLAMVGVTLCYRDGYFAQGIDERGRQVEEPGPWSPADVLEPLDARCTVEVSGRTVAVGAWQRRLVGTTGHVVPVLFLDTALPENEPEDRSITDQLYSGDRRHRLRQEVVLGMGGVRVLEALGWSRIRTFHMNEGHSALLTLALHPRSVGRSVRNRCVFTTHTPVPAGHDRFDEPLVRDVLGEAAAGRLGRLGGLADGELNMTRLGLSCARFANAVSVRHAEVCRAMFPAFPVHAVTNGVHAATWVAPSTAELFDRHIPDWRWDNASLRTCATIPVEEVEAAHRAAKRRMMALVAARTGQHLDPAVLTLGVARRAATYKRLDLLLRDPDRLADVVERAGPLQIVYSGKAHPQDQEGKAVIERLLAAGRELAGQVRVVFVPGYSLEVAAALCAGTDVWVNTPVRPMEASGTSGMKAALNGVPSLSVLDGWWAEGHLEGLTGWSFGGLGEVRDDAADAEALYDKLGSVVAPLYYGDGLGAVRRSTLALNGSWFTTERMVRQYAVLAYEGHPG